MENHKEINNKKLSEIYRECSKAGTFHYVMGKGQNSDITDLENRYHENCKRYRNPDYSEEEYVKMMLSARELWKTFGFSRFGVAWTDFNSPTEVVGFNAVSFIWSPRLIAVNELDPTGKYEIDLQPKDMYGNTLYLIDIQGKGHEKRKEMDKEKKKYFEEQGIPFVQVQGIELVNQHSEWIVRFCELFKKSLAEVELNFLCSHPKHFKNNMCFKRKS